MAANKSAEKSAENKITLPEGVDLLNKSFTRLFMNEELDKETVIGYLAICEAEWVKAMVNAKKYVKAYDSALAIIDTARDDFAEDDLKSLDARTLKGL